MQELTTKEASDLSGYHPDTLRELIRDGKLKARKFNQSWAIDRASLDAYMNDRGIDGGKRGPKTKGREFPP